VDRGEAFAFGDDVHRPQPGERQLEEELPQPELTEHREGRRMDGVAAEVAEEVGMLLQHRDPAPGAREQVTEHHPGGTAARDDALALELDHPLILPWWSLGGSRG